MKAEDAKEVRELRKENQRLKRIVADQALDIVMLKELNRETSSPEPPPTGRCGLKERFGVSERRACRAVDQPAPPSASPPRSLPTTSSPCGPSCETSLVGAPAGDGAGPTSRRRGLAGRSQEAHPAPVAIRGPSGSLPREEAPLRGIGQPVGAMCPIRPNVIWAMDLQFDRARPAVSAARGLDGWAVLTAKGKVTRTSTTQKCAPRPSPTRLPAPR
jgi:hypothetical protein